MSIVKVATQAELDAAIQARNVPVLVGNGTFRLDGNIYVRVSDTSSPRVECYNTSSPTVECYNISSPTVECADTSSPRVECSDTSSPRVDASGFARLLATGPVVITASDNVYVLANHVALVEGGYIVEYQEPRTASDWCSHYGVSVRDGVATLYKAVDDNFKSSHGMSYEPGSQPSASDWDGGKAECGGGLHFSPRPMLAQRFAKNATRYVACPVALDEIVVHAYASYPNKVKAPRVCGPIVEVDIYSEPVAAKESTS